MSKGAKITITVPDDVLAAVKKERSVRNESRSKFFRCAAEARLRSRADAGADRRYARGYQQAPETETSVSEQLAAVAFLHEKWE